MIAIWRIATCSDTLYPLDASQLFAQSVKKRPLLGSSWVLVLWKSYLKSQDIVGVESELNVLQPDEAGDQEP